MNHVVKAHRWAEIAGQKNPQCSVIIWQFRGSFFVTTFVKNINFHHFRKVILGSPEAYNFKNAVIWIILSKSIVGLRYLLKISYSFHLLLVTGSFLSKKSLTEGYFGTLLRPKFFMGNVIWFSVKIQLWAGLFEKK